MRNCFKEFDNRERQCDTCGVRNKCRLEAMKISDKELDLKLLDRFKTGTLTKAFRDWYSKMYKRDGTGATVVRWYGMNPK